LVLLREERFEEALDVLGTLPLDSADDPDVLLLRAVLLTHTGLLGTAEEVCGRLLKLDELSASAHYVLALCRESAGDLSGAVKHDRIAVYLDPSFAMPRLHLGLLARRSNDSVAMRRELSQAITLLEHEDASRLLLFGGGFGRDALIELCHAEMRDKASS
jgi:chemotaxis protein methyltransferase CheR